MQQYDLFVCYAAADEAWAEGYLLQALTSAGLRCFTVADFTLGAPRLTEYERGVRSSGHTLLVLSRAFFADDYAELTGLLAQTHGVDSQSWPVIWLKLEALELPPLLGALVGVDAADPATREHAIADLCARLDHKLAQPDAAPPCPYPGMAPFTEADSDRFFGREDDIQELVADLHVYPFLAVIGPSGSGKSSLVLAGLAPALRTSSLFGSGGWIVRSFRPTAEPMDTLANALQDSPADSAGAKTAGQPPPRLLLVVDQFEELFTLAPSKVSSFLCRLEPIYQAPSCFVVITARADFYAELMATALWPTIQAHRFEIAPLSEDGLREAIVRPAAAVGVHIDDALVERLVRDAGGEPGILPLVQETLLLMWDRLERHYLPLSAYDAVTRGGEPGRTGLQAAIARRAESAYGSLSPDGQLVARRIFVSLVQFGEGRADTRRQETVADLHALSDNSALVDDTLRRLADSRLIVLGGDQSERTGQAETTVDIAHEALISGWPRFQRWLLEDRDATLRQRRTALQVTQWKQSGNDPSFLYSGALLQEALRYQLQHPHELNADESAFLAACRRQQAARDRARYLGQAAGVAVGTGVGYGVAFGLAFPATNAGLAASQAGFLLMTTVLIMLALGQAVGFSIGLGLWWFHGNPNRQAIAAGVAGAVVGALTYGIFVTILSTGSLTLANATQVVHYALVGALLGGSLGVGAALAPRRWPVLGTSAGGLVGVLAGVASGGLTWPLIAAVVSGVALGLFAGLGLQLAAAEPPGQRSQPATQQA
ncbi:MAG: TIR domain-containing protein [Chloroflexi bacterium]|nr:TIR domain-containing protein [Chloroflexota bacterium]